ncbi:hypothetical protein ABEB36_008312 [Hypothenemus hampei]|uniref:Protein singed wings 2 n=1 Tax=Hypothenemus hampei TaxID=57062 RepID=A0ABD1ELG7_HYPHA
MRQVQVQVQVITKIIKSNLIWPISEAQKNDTACREIKDQLFCTSTFPRGSYYPGVTALRVSGISLELLDLNFFLNKKFLDLRILSIEGTNKTLLNVFRMPREPMLNIKELHLVKLQIQSLPENLTFYFPNLEVLNVSGNFLSDFPKNFPLKSLKNVYLIDNKWNCSKSLEWSLNLDVTVFKDLEELTCFRMPHNNKPVLAIAKFRKVIDDTCTPNCSCQLIKCVTDMMTDILEPIIEVNCSFRGFTEVPVTLPPKTKTLRLEGNFIEDLGPLKKNPIYRDLWEIFLDGNFITSINNLESSYWLSHFRVFSLKNNRINEIPVYAIDNALQHNPNMPNALRMSLGGNPWRCDCIFAPRFKEMLLKYAPQIWDLREVKCSKGSEKSMVPVIDLSRGSVCHSPSEYTIQEALDLLNGILGFLIIFVLGKLAYDYYHFKKTGRLPWIVRKLP